MPADYWGYLDPEREELQNALLEAERRRMDTQTRLSEMLGAQSLQAEENERQRIARQIELDEASQKAMAAQTKLQKTQFMWEQEEAELGRVAEAQKVERQELSDILQKEMETTGKLQVAGMEQQTALEKMYAEQQTTLQEAGMVRATALELGEMTQETAMAELNAPGFKQVGNALYYTIPSRGVVREVAYVPEGTVLEYGQRLAEKRTGEVLTESEDVMQDNFHIYGLEGGKLVSRARKIEAPEGTVGVYTKEGAIDFIDPETNEVVDRLLTTEPPAATFAEVMQAEARVTEVEYDYAAAMAGLDAAKEMNWDTLDSNERIEAAKRVGEDLDRALEKDLIVIKAGELTLDRDKMMQEAKTAEERQQIDKYIVELQERTKENVAQLQTQLGYAHITSGEFIAKLQVLSDEKVEWWKITKDTDIANLEHAAALGAIEVTREGIKINAATAEFLELGRQGTEEANRALTEQLAVMQNNLGLAHITSEDFRARIADSTKRDVAWWEIEGREDISILENATELKGIEVTEKGIVLKDEAARLFNLSDKEEAEAERELTRQLADKKTELGYAGLTDEMIIAKMENETERLKIEGERIADEKGVAREDMKYLTDVLMDRATAQIRATFGDYTDADRVRAVGVLVTLIETDLSISPETKARWLEIAPHLGGVTLAEMIDPDKKAEYVWMRDALNRAHSAALAEAGLPPPPPTVKGISLPEIMKGYEKEQAKSNRKGKAWLKKYGLTPEEYIRLVRESGLLD